MDLNLEIIQNSFEEVQPRIEEFATRFYTILFQDYPASKLLLAGSSADQQKRLLVAPLLQVIQNLGDPVFLGDYLGRMGEHYADHGTQDEQLEWFSRSFQKTLQMMFAPGWNRETWRQWALALDLVAAILREGIRRRQETPMFRKAS